MKVVKKIAVCALAACAVPFAVTAELSKAEWQAKVGDCASDPSAMKATIAQIPAAEQAEFLGKVNEAISKKAGSDEAKAADFYAANKAAVAGAADKKAVLAEVYATVPVEYLTVINERFATELFSRNANPDKPISDKAFEELTTNTLAVINKRCESAGNTDVRQTFAALMFLRASGGSPAGLSSTLVSQMTDAKARESAGGWIADAMGSNGNESSSYDNMLAAANAGDEPDQAVVLQMIGPNMIMDSLLADLKAPGTQSASGPASGFGAGGFTTGSIAGAAVPADGAIDLGLNRIPRGAIGSADGVGGNSEGTNADSENPYYSSKRGSSGAVSTREPFGYIY